MEHCYESNASSTELANMPGHSDNNAHTVLGVDLGTQGIKVILYSSLTKTVVRTASSPLKLVSRKDGTREQQPQSWVSGLQACLSQIPSDLKSTVIAIGISGQQHGFVPVDAAGQALAPAKLWCDTTAAIECNEIIDTLGRETCLSTVGSITTSFTAPKVRWMKKKRPELYERLHTIMLPHDYLNFFLTGERTAECGDASGTALLDVRTRGWSARMLHAVDADRDLATCLPRLIEAHESAGTILPEVAELLGLPVGVIVSAGGGDNMMAAIGTGNVVKGKLTASLGTSGTLFAYADEAVVDETGVLAAFCASTGGWLPLLCMMNCTVATEQIRELFSLEVGEVDGMVAGVTAGCDGVITVPFYSGERVPDLPGGKGVIFGLDVGNMTQGHLMRSAMEAAVFGLKRGLDVFAKYGMRFEEVTVTGGGSGSAEWRQICADVLNLRVRMLRQTENAAMGAALQALWCYEHCEGEGRSIESIVAEHLEEDVEKECLPDAERVRVYERCYTRYVELVEALTPLFRRAGRDGLDDEDGESGS